MTGPNFDLLYNEILAKNPNYNFVTTVLSVMVLVTEN